MKRRLLNGSKLNGYRTAARLTYDELTRRSGVPKPTVCRYLSGTTGYTPDNLDCLIQAINEARSEMQLPGISVIDVLDREETTLSDCLLDFLQWAPFINAERLNLKIISIDMTYGWENLLRALERSAAARIQIELLMLGSVGECDSIHPSVSAIIRSWSRASEAQYEMLCAQFHPHRRGDRVRMEIRRYNELPTYHGVRAEAGGDSRHYVTKCTEREWIVPDYGWGEHEYLIIASDETAEQANAYRAAFDALFSRLWAESKAGSVLGC